MRRKQPLDHRLWSSMTLAAICAILALIVLSIVPRYASKSLPSRLFAVTPTVSASTMPTDKAASVSDTEKNRARTVAPITSVGHPDTSLTSGKLVDAAAHEKRRRAVDDDYVAPDTYKYYGNAPSEAHR